MIEFFCIFILYYDIFYVILGCEASVLRFDIVPRF